MIVKWRTGGGWGHEYIQRVECVRETAKTVVVLVGLGNTTRERKALKHSDYAQYHDSWQSAKEYLLAGARRTVDAYKARLHDARTQLGMIESLKEPVEQAQEAAR